MPDSGPSPTTIKRLFALSGNLCAFPRCTALMSANDRLLGEVCHIKGKRPEAPRYDPRQTPAERHHYDNLILLCPNHHTIIDHDVESYTVERLHKMKSNHEARATPISENIADQVVAAYFTLATIGQTGGIAAQNVTAHQITLASGDSLAQRRQLEALENLWSIIRMMRKEYGPIIYVDSILIANEMKDYFESGRYHQIMDVVKEYANPKFVASKIISVDPDRERPFVAHKVWSIVFALRALYGRAALLMQNSFLNARYEDWRMDSGFDRILRGLLSDSFLDSARNMPIGGLQAIIDNLEMQFLTEAGMQK